MSRFSPSGDNGRNRHGRRNSDKGSMQSQLRAVLPGVIEGVGEIVSTSTNSTEDSISELDARISALKKEKELPETSDSRAGAIQREILALVIKREGLREKTRVRASDLLDPKERTFRQHAS